MLLHSPMKVNLILPWRVLLSHNKQFVYQIVNGLIHLVNIESHLSQLFVLLLFIQFVPILSAFGLFFVLLYEVFVHVLIGVWSQVLDSSATPILNPWPFSVLPINSHLDDMVLIAPIYFGATTIVLIKDRAVVFFTAALLVSFCRRIRLSSRPKHLVRNNHLRFLNLIWLVFFYVEVFDTVVKSLLEALDFEGFRVDRLLIWMISTMSRWYCYIWGVKTIINAPYGHPILIFLIDFTFQIANTSDTTPTIPNLDIQNGFWILSRLLS